MMSGTWKTFGYMADGYISGHIGKPDDKRGGYRYMENRLIKEADTDIWKTG